MTDKPQAAGDMVMVPRELLQSARSFVELTYHDEGGDEAVDAKHVMGEIDKALAPATAERDATCCTDPGHSHGPCPWASSNTSREALESVLAWYDHDGSVGGIVEPIDLVKKALSHPPSTGDELRRELENLKRRIKDHGEILAGEDTNNDVWRDTNNCLVETQTILAALAQVQEGGGT